MKKLGLVAGDGALPVHLARHCRAKGRGLFVVRLAPSRNPELAEFDGVEVEIGQVGAALKALKAAGCETVCLAGMVARPDFTKIKPDARGIALLPGAIAAAARGDDALLSFMMLAFERSGFHIEGADEVMAELLLAEGPLGARRPGKAELRDIDRGLAAARAIGALDIGQAAVAGDGLVLALEAQEGTDEMLRRVANLPSQRRGAARERRGVLVKISKPRQDRRVDLPTVGPTTIELAARAGLAGIAGEAGRLLVLEREAVRAGADRLGMFVVGVR
ncbi:MAG: LpxI family protein [Caulobacteraceae bacterium]